MALYFQEGDKEELLKEVTPLDAVEYLGIETRRQGHNLSILCPAHDHNDQHFGSCIISHEGTRCKCYACGRSFSALTIILEETGCSYYEGMCTLAYLSGHDSDFEARNRTSNTRNDLFKSFNEIRKKDIGISPYSRIRNVTNYSSERPESGDYFKDQDGMYVVCSKSDWNPWRELISEDPETADWLIRNKCKERMITIDYMIRQIKDPFSTPLSTLTYEVMEKFRIRLPEVLRLLKLNYSEVEEMYVEHGGSIVGIKEIALNLIGMHAVLN